VDTRAAATGNRPFSGKELDAESGVDHSAFEARPAFRPRFS
jgi:hypothetical protein